MYGRCWNDLAQIVVAIVARYFFNNVNFAIAIITPRWNTHNN